MSISIDDIFDLIAESAFIDNRDSIIPEAELVKDLGIDGMDLLLMHTAIEELLDMEIEDEELSTLLTVQDVIDFIDNKFETFLNASML